MGGEVGARTLNRGKHDDYSKAKGSSRNAVDLEQRIKVFRVRCRSNLRLYDRDVLVIARQQAISTQAFHLCSSAKAISSRAFRFCSRGKAISSLPSNWGRFPTIC